MERREGQWLIIQEVGNPDASLEVVDVIEETWYEGELRVGTIIQLEHEDDEPFYEVLYLFPADVSASMTEIAIALRQLPDDEIVVTYRMLLDRVVQAGIEFARTRSN